jgi:dihydrofolate synthase/folylpolyglutamate synthase
MHFSGYQEVLTYLYNNLPMFQRQGASAFRKDLSKTIQLDEVVNHPHRNYKTIHIAGTNGKGSTAHMLSAVLQRSGYKTGLYTSPHLRDFTERIKVNGRPMEPEAVSSFMNRYFDDIERIKPSFFEITVAMAFEYFHHEGVEIAVVETGMGGRLDSTNIISPVVSLITNVSFDHQQYLGNSLPEIAGEKAGIIKRYTPVVISERQEVIVSVFEQKANLEEAPVYFATDDFQVKKEGNDFHISQEGKRWNETIRLPMPGNYQQYNLAGVLKAIEVLKSTGISISREDTLEGLNRVTQLTGLKGRYQVVKENPKVIADVAHNEAGLSLVMEQLRKEKFNRLFMVLGVVNDKELSGIWAILPRDAYYFFTQANIPRALSADILAEKAWEKGFKGEVVPAISGAYKKALDSADKNDLIFIGGSTFTVAEIEDIYNEE